MRKDGKGLGGIIFGEDWNRKLEESGWNMKELEHRGKEKQKDSGWRTGGGQTRNRNRYEKLKRKVKERRVYLNEKKNEMKSGRLRKELL